MPNKLQGVTLTDRIKVPTQRKFTDSGQMIVPCAFARSGSQVYSAGSLGLTDVKADTPVTVMRDEADVFDEDSVNSFRTDPKKDGKNISVTADNSAELQVGVLEGLPTREDTKLTGTLVIARQDAIDMIEDGTQELSAGYTCDVEMVDGENGETLYYQRNIRANHIAIVDKGRAGSAVRIADDAEPVVDVEADAAKDEPVVDEDKAVCKDITPEVVVKDEKPNNDGVEVKDEADPGADVDVVVAKEIKVGDEGYAVYSALTALNDEITAVNYYVDAIQYCEDESLKAIFQYALAEEQDHCVKLLDWLTSQNVSPEQKVTMDAAEPLVAVARTKKDVVVADELEEAAKTIARLTDELDTAVEARIEVIMVAKEFTDLEDFSGKSCSEIRKSVVADVMPKLDLEGKDEAYVNARFDIIVEDSVSGETSMSKVLRKSTAEVVDTKPVDHVAESRQRMIDRQKSS